MTKIKVALLTILFLVIIDIISIKDLNAQEFTSRFILILAGGIIYLFSKSLMSRTSWEKREYNQKLKLFGVCLILMSMLNYLVLNTNENDVSLRDTQDTPQDIPPVPKDSESAASYPIDNEKPAASEVGLSQTTNSIGMEFVLIPSGEFMMGSPSGEEDISGNKGPVHKVTIEEPFYLGRFEVTQEQWRKVMGNNPSKYEGDDLPVEKVTWNDVQQFIDVLNEMEGTDKYRLPSEAEWEYACRAGTTTRYSFGDDESKLGDYAWYGEDWYSGSTHPVGQKKPNTWGLYDMHGNVWEWCQDRWHENYNGAPSDGSAWEDGGFYTRVTRGGSLYDLARACKSDVRSASPPDGHSINCGFRLLMTL